jgi:hypothetical protein
MQSQPARLPPVGRIDLHQPGERNLETLLTYLGTVLLLPAPEGSPRRGGTWRQRLGPGEPGKEAKNVLGYRHRS